MDEKTKKKLQKLFIAALREVKQEKEAERKFKEEGDRQVHLLVKNLTQEQDKPSEPGISWEITEYSD